MKSLPSGPSENENRRKRKRSQTARKRGRKRDVTSTIVLKSARLLLVFRKIYKKKKKRVQTRETVASGPRKSKKRERKKSPKRKRPREIERQRERERERGSGKKQNGRFLAIENEQKVAHESRKNVSRNVKRFYVPGPPRFSFFRTTSDNTQCVELAKKKKERKNIQSKSISRVPRTITISNAPNSRADYINNTQTRCSSTLHLRLQFSRTDEET